MRLGIFGGTFDPVHYGHLLLAESCREQARLDEVFFIPTAVSPLKQTQPPSAAKHRLEMLRLATSGQNAFRVSELEIERGGVSYTVDTLSRMHQEHPAAELFFLLGADALHDLPSWREPRTICSLALPVVVRRQGWPEPPLSVLQSLLEPARLEQVRELVVDMPQFDLSSTDIRARVATGRSIRYQLPRAVEEYILEHGLYSARDAE